MSDTRPRSRPAQMSEEAGVILASVAGAAEHIMTLRKAGVLHVEAKHREGHVILRLAPIVERPEVYETDVNVHADATTYGAGR